jgi:hypothetical protein
VEINELTENIIRCAKEIHMVDKDLLCDLCVLCGKNFKVRINSMNHLIKGENR